MMGFVCNSQNDSWLNSFIVFPCRTLQSGRCIAPFMFFIAEAFPKLPGYVPSVLWGYGNPFSDTMERSCYSAAIKHRGSLG